MVNKIEVVEGGYFERRIMSFENNNEAYNFRLSLGETRLESGRHLSALIGRGKASSEYIHLGLTIKGGEYTRYNGMPIGVGNLRIYPEGSDILYQSMGEAEWFAYSIPREKLQKALNDYDDGKIKLIPNRIMTFPLKAENYEQLKTMFQEIRQMACQPGNIELSEDVTKMLSAALLNSFIKAICASDGQPDSIKPNSLAQLHGQLIMATEQLILSGQENNLKLSDLAKATGYTLRALEFIFKNSVGMSPKSWFVNMRMNGALRDLMEAKPNMTVSDVATRWGFQHLARFSAQYRDMFGELPSKTLSRVRERNK
ncbi:AraC family transcriptional regulator [Budviciaceae bacterium BWR-B9]|uniref:AraC family transcriptional regulator n=1 Tax=Limnobaculum allomyrinae TaxID=2791986 RepID=A0ABS1IKH4_9GAMM|nr:MULTISPECIES: helix-turn-helix domain-containing protein [Limnobaculum]MBK5142251.1 AraC family transcriptional regulator [Limnobaculum allomyrinae]MBV7690865.1 helix-turn-helix domain-containing protein [Limnobaculum sp. M2-1]